MRYHLNNSNDKNWNSWLRCKPLLLCTQTQKMDDTRTPCAARMVRQMTCIRQQYINTFHNYWDLTTVHNHEHNSNQTWIHTSPAWASALRRTGLPWKEAIWETKLTKQHFSNSVPFANSMIPCLAFLRYDLCHLILWNPTPCVVFLSEIFLNSISPLSCPLTFLDARILDQGLHT